MRLPKTLAATMALGGLIAACPPAIAGVAGYTFTPIDVPGSAFGTTGFFGLSINDLGQVAGDYFDNAGEEHGFLYARGEYTTFDLGGNTGPADINDRGQMVGCCGYLYTKGTFIGVNVPGAAFTQPNGINDHSQIVGSYSDNTGTHGFLETHGSLTTLDVPGSSFTVPFRINNRGQIVGWYYDNGEHGFLRDTNGSFTTIDLPGGSFNFLSGINDQGQIVGSATDSAGDEVSFLYTQGQFTTIGGANTQVDGINDRGQIVGFSNVNIVGLGFLATPINGLAMSAADPLAARTVPEPSSLALITVGLVGVGLALRRKRA
jgi:probable HAF family extracellular repeat protein